MNSPSSPRKRGSQEPERPLVARDPRVRGDDGGAEHSLAEPAILLPFLLITLIWSSTWIVIKDQLGSGAAGVPPTWSVAYRFAFAAAAMFAVARLSGAGLAIGRRGHLYAAAIGLPQFVLNFNLVYFAERYVTSGVVAVVFALLVVPNALLARIFFGHRVTARFLLGSTIAMAGVGLLFLAELRVSAVDPGAVLAGIGLTLLAVLAASVANVLQLAAPVRALPVASLLAWAMLYATLANAVTALILFGAPVAEARIGYWIGLIYLGLAASALAFLLYIRIIRAIGPGKAAYSSVLVPIVAMLISTVAEDYRWTGIAAAGGVLAVAGLLVALGARRPVAAPAVPGD